MTYTKPADVTYTEMAIWIDTHAYSDKCDSTLLYEYLYHLSNMLANQFSYFKSADEYDQFSLVSASRLFMRLNNVKQFQYDDAGNPKMKQIKSILNYMKKVIYPYKVDFEIEFKLTDQHLDVIPVGMFDLGSHIAETANLFDRLDFVFTLGDLSKIIKAYLKKIPYKRQSPEWSNIYLSCLLTLLDSITLTNRMITKYESNSKDSLELIDKLYYESRYREPVLFHLPDSMSTYICVLVNELYHVISTELSWRSHDLISSEATLKSLICTALDKENA